MKITKRILALTLALLMLFAAIACGKDKGPGLIPDSTPPEQKPEVKDPPVNLPEIVLMKEEATLKVGETLSLAGAYILKNCTDATVTYGTGDPMIATVDVNGTIRGISEGETTITLSAANGACKDTMKITVTAAGNIEPGPGPGPGPGPDDPPEPPAPKLELSFTEAALTVGDTKQIAYTILNMGENTTVSFVCSSGAVSVNENGLIEAKEAGECVVTVVVTDGPSAEITITVKAPDIPLPPESTIPHYEPTFDPEGSYISVKAKNVKHVFFHNLIAFEDKTGYYDTDCLYVSEFKAMLEQMYDNGYVLINIDYMYEYYEEDGVLKAKLRDTIKIPSGKKPLVISVDNVCYPSNEHGMGRVDRLVVKNGKLYTYTKLADGTDFYSDDNEVFTILENFIAQHPDFSFSGARCVVAPSGYAGLFGYNTTTKATAAQKQEAEVEVKKIVDWFRGNGYTFACHSYSHGDYSTMSLAGIANDFAKWDDEVVPYIGKTHVFIYPFGNFTPKNSDQAKELSARGFAVFCATSMNGVNWDNFPLAGNCYNERIILDGRCLRTYADHENMKALFDAYSVYDNTQRKIKLEKGGTQASIALNENELTLEMGKNFTLKATVTGLSAKVVYTSDNPGVVVDQNGKVMALAVCEATVTATCGVYTATCKVTVTEPRPDPKITLSCNQLTLRVGESVFLTASSNWEDMVFVWTTSNEEALFVDDGNLQAMMEAEAVIVRVEAEDGSCYAECMVDIVATG